MKYPKQKYRIYDKYTKSYIQFTNTENDAKNYIKYNYRSNTNNLTIEKTDAYEQYLRGLNSPIKGGEIIK